MKRDDKSRDINIAMETNHWYVTELTKTKTKDYIKEIFILTALNCVSL